MQCIECAEGYQLSSDSSSCLALPEETSTVMKANTVTTQALAGAAVALGGTISVLSVSSPQAVWMMVRQFQLLMLMPLTGAFFPSSIIQYLTGMSFMNFDFDFIPFPEIPFLDMLYDYFDFEHGHEYLKDIGVESGSSLLNSMGFFTMIAVHGALHI